MKSRLIKICLIISLVVNILFASSGLLYLNYQGLSIPYAISRIPHIIWPETERQTSEEADNNLKEIILQECPNLKKEGMTDYEMVALLRDWAAKTIDVSTYSLLLDIRVPGFNSQSAYEMYRAFAEDWGGVACGSSAAFLMKVYGLFGYESYVFCVGFVGQYSHGITLVFIDCDGQEILSYQDAFFNETFEDFEGRPMDYFEMLRILRQGRHDKIVMVVPETPLLRDHLFYTGDPVDNIPWMIYENCAAAENTTINGITRCKCEVACSVFWSQAESLLGEWGLPPEYAYLNLFPLSISGGPRAEQIMEEVHNITEWPLPLEKQK